LPKTSENSHFRSAVHNHSPLSQPAIKFSSGVMGD
jgi:hypothetical protein